MSNPIRFNMDEYEIRVIRCVDHYSIAYDVTIEIKDPVAGQTWTQVIKSGGDDQRSIEQAFREYNEAGWIRTLRPSSE